MRQIKLFLNSLRKYGVRITIEKSFVILFSKIPMQSKFKFIKENTIIAGILQEKTFVAPSIVQIDLTNKCNNSCIGCWLHSPYLSLTTKEKIELNQTIPKKIFFQTLNDLHKFGTKRILLSGGGEPLLHPNFKKIISEIQNKKLECSFITNLIPANKQLIDKIIDLDIHQVFVSLWASNAKTYIKTHPTQNKEVFNHIIKLLKHFTSEKEKKKKGPAIILLNVISKANYHDVLNIAKLASNLGVDRIEFVTMDLIPGSTDSFKMNFKEINSIKEQIKEIEKHTKDGFFGKTELWGFDRFKKRIYDYHESKGFDKNIVDSVPCLAGWNYARIMADGSVIPCCKAAKHPLGNINKKSFKEIWFSKKYHEFRIMAKREKKSHPYFKKINCYAGCDNYTENKVWFDRITKLTKKQKKLLIDFKW